MAVHYREKCDISSYQLLIKSRVRFNMSTICYICACSSNNLFSHQLIRFLSLPSKERAPLSGAKSCISLILFLQCPFSSLCFYFNKKWVNFPTIFLVISWAKLASDIVALNYIWLFIGWIYKILLWQLLLYKEGHVLWLRGLKERK